MANLDKVLDNYAVPKDIPPGWWVECRIYRCYPLRGYRNAIAKFPGIEGLETSNWATTHSQLMQLWLQARQLEEASRNAKRVLQGPHTRDEYRNAISSAFQLRPHLSALPTADELEEAKHYLEGLISRAPRRELAVDIAWTLVLAQHHGDAKRLLTEYQAWDLCPMLVIIMGDRHLGVSELLKAIHNPKNADAFYRDLIEEGTLRAREGDPQLLEDATTEYKRAFELYSLAVSSARSPVAAAECGYLLLRRCGIEEDALTPLTEDGGFQPDTLVHLQQACLPGGEPTCSTPEDLLQLATQSYGRAFRFDDAWLKNRKKKDADERWYYAAEWMALDGLSVAFRELGDWAAVKETCLVFLGRWGYSGDDQDQELYLRCQKFLREALAKLPGSRKLFTERCSVRYSDIWEKLPTPVRQYLVSALQLEETLTGEMDWSGLVIDYAKAVESLLRIRLGAYVDDNPDTTVARMLRTTINRRRRMPVRRFSNLALSTFKDGLKDIEPLHRDSTLKQLAQSLERLADIRGRAAHADEIWKVPREEAEMAKNVSETVLRLLAGLRLP